VYSKNKKKVKSTSQKCPLENGYQKYAVFEERGI
jgi:hypothetical protein